MFSFVHAFSPAAFGAQLFAYSPNLDDAACPEIQRFDTFSREQYARAWPIRLTTYHARFGRLFAGRDGLLGKGGQRLFSAIRERLLSDIEIDANAGAPVIPADLVPVMLGHNLFGEKTFFGIPAPLLLGDSLYHPGSNFAGQINDRWREGSHHLIRALLRCGVKESARSGQFHNGGEWQCMASLGR